jgi:surfactin synthase thioesterase subunit
MKMQLFCFTFAGGTAAFFEQLEQACEGKVDFIKLEYPGHGSRRKEKLCSSFDEVADDLGKVITSKYAGGEYGLLGYSMGSIAAIEILKRIPLTLTLPKPKHVFLAAHEPRAVVNLENIDENSMDEYVKTRTIQFGGVPECLYHNNSFWRMYLPLYKADYLMINKYDFSELELETDVPATIFYSETDTPIAEMKNWKKYFTNECEFMEYVGNHFFINDHYREMAEIIMERLAV